MGKLVDLKGQTFGSLTILDRAPNPPTVSNNSNSAYWNCLCKCGNTLVVRSYNLKSGNTVSCGCLKKERGRQKLTKHGLSGTHVHNCWRGMLDRCRNKNNVRYYRYGGRGITVCKEWEDFQNFYKDMGEPPTEKHSIDRIDVNGNYEPTNCRWATSIEQANNRDKILPPNTQYLEFNGKRKTLKEWSIELNIPRATIYCRLYKGYPIEKVLSKKNYRFK